MGTTSVPPTANTWGTSPDPRGIAISPGGEAAPEQGHSRGVAPENSRTGGSFYLAESVKAAPPALTPVGSTSAPASPEQRAVGIVGFVLAVWAVLLAYGGGAGITTTPESYPNSSALSVVWLAFCVTLLGVGAWMVAAYGSRLVTDVRREAGGTETRSHRLRNKLPEWAIFLSIFGGGLLLMGLSLPLSPALGTSHGPLPVYLSPSVTWIPATLIAVGLSAIASAVALFLTGRSAAPIALRNWWRRIGRWAALVVAVVLVLTVPLLTVPVSQSYSTTLGILHANAGSITFTSFPQGSEIHGAWRATPATQVELTIQGNDYNLTQDGTYGFFNFTATGTPLPLYTFWLNEANTSIQVSVALTCNFSAPVWSWPPGEPGAPTSYS